MIEVKRESPYVHIVDGPIPSDLALIAQKIALGKKPKTEFTVKLFDQVLELDFDGTVSIPFTIIGIFNTEEGIIVYGSPIHDGKFYWLGSKSVTVAKEGIEILELGNRAPWIDVGKITKFQYNPETGKGLAFPTD